MNCWPGSRLLRGERDCEFADAHATTRRAAWRMSQKISRARSATSSPNVLRRIRQTATRARKSWMRIFARGKGGAANREFPLLRAAAHEPYSGASMAASRGHGRSDCGDRSGNSWYVIRRQQAAKSGPHAPVSVLVGDFENHTGDPVLDDTLEPMLGVALEGASFVNAYSRGMRASWPRNSRIPRTNSTSSQRGWSP
jgi:hypothetical protein